MKPWLQTPTDSEAGARSADFWASMREEIDAGEFWADLIKRYKTDAHARLQLALRNLPLPAAFREASIALRSLIRTKRKEKQVYEEELACLYWLAAIESLSVAYSEKLREPGFNVIESIPGAVLRNLEFEYRVLGYEKLKLNATEKKWIIEIWGSRSIIRRSTSFIAPSGIPMKTNFPNLDVGEAFLVNKTLQPYVLLSLYGTKTAAEIRL